MEKELTKKFSLCGTDGERLEVSVGKIVPTGYDSDMDCTLAFSVSCGCFSVKDAVLWGKRSYIADFYENLSACWKSLSGAAVFHASFGCELTFTVTMLKYGHAEVKGKCEPLPNSRSDGGCALAFTFKTDQTCIAQTLRELGEWMEGWSER